MMNLKKCTLTDPQVSTAAALVCCSCLVKGIAIVFRSANVMMSFQDCMPTDPQVSIAAAFACCSCLVKGIEIVEDRFAGAVTLHAALSRALKTDADLGRLLHAEAVERKVHLFKVQYVYPYKAPWC